MAGLHLGSAAATATTSPLLLLLKLDSLETRTTFFPVNSSLPTHVVPAEAGVVVLVVVPVDVVEGGCDVVEPCCQCREM